MLSQRSTLSIRAPRFSRRRLAIVGLAALLWAADAPAEPIHQAQAVTRVAYDVVLSSAPPDGGALIEIVVPADALPNLHPSIIERPGMEHRIR
jgi:hypothetical protein